MRQEADDEQKRDLLDQDQLPEIAEAHVDELRRHRAEHGRMERVGHLPANLGRYDHIDTILELIRAMDKVVVDRKGNVITFSWK